MWKKTAGASKLPELFERMQAVGVTRDGLTILCIGTDRSTGDSLGPLTGTLLVERGFARVVGTLQAPCDADTWSSCLAQAERLAAGGPLLAVDACLGHPHAVGQLQLAAGPLEAGRSMRRGFPPVGSCSIAGIVGPLRDNPLRALETVPLGRVWTMAHAIADGLAAWFPACGGAGCEGDRGTKRQ